MKYRCPISPITGVGYGYQLRDVSELHKKCLIFLMSVSSKPKQSEIVVDTTFKIIILRFNKC